MELKERLKADFRVDMISGSGQTRMFSDLLDRAFGVRKGRFLDDFPVWDDALVPNGGRMMRFGAFDARERLVACAGARVAPLRGLAEQVPVALIGAVATDEERRGQGLASGLVKLATEWARGRGAAAALLWGSEHALYQRLGFELCGTQVRVRLSALELESNRSEKVGEGLTPALFRLLMERGTGLALQASDEIWVRAHRNVRWYWLGSANAPQAYVAIGRGIDMTGLIHEWGGERSRLRLLLGILRELSEGSAELSILGAPALLREFGLWDSTAEEEYLCLARALDPVRMLRAFQPDARLPAGFMELEEGARARVLFGGPSGPAAPTVSAAPDAVLPLPLWIWGLDAV